MTTIRLADGTEIDVSTGKVVSPDNGTTDGPPEPDIAKETTTFTPATQRSLADLPETGARGNVLALAVALQLFGLSDDEIAMQMRADVASVKALLLTSSASSMRDAIIEGVSRRYEPAVRSVLNEASVDAAKVLRDTVRLGTASNRLRAASQVLDRTGYASVNVTEHRVSGGLVVEYVSDTKPPTVEFESLNGQYLGGT